MARQSQAEKEKSHLRILDAAAQLLRENGIESTSVADVMKAAGMTHGGFYRHFKSKEDLLIAGFRRAADQNLERPEQANSDSDREYARREYVETYLSEEHAANLGSGCPLAALADEVARAGGPVKKEAERAASRTCTILGDGDPEDGRALLSLMLGSVILARLADNQEEAEKYLDAGRKGVEILEAR